MVIMRMRMIWIFRIRTMVIVKMKIVISLTFLMIMEMILIDRIRTIVRVKVRTITRLMFMRRMVLNYRIRTTFYVYLE